MATVPAVRYQRKKKIGDDKSPTVYVLKPRPGESRLYSTESLARGTESVGSFSVEDVEYVMQSFVRSMKKVLVAGSKAKIDDLGIFYTTLTCPGAEQEKDCMARNITRVNLHFKIDNFPRLVNDSTATIHDGDNNMVLELTSKNVPVPRGSGDGGGSSSGGGFGDGSGSGGGGGDEEAPDPVA